MKNKDFLQKMFVLGLLYSTLVAGCAKKVDRQPEIFNPVSCVQEEKNVSFQEPTSTQTAAEQYAAFKPKERKVFCLYDEDGNITLKKTFYFSGECFREEGFYPNGSKRMEITFSKSGQKQREVFCDEQGNPYKETLYNAAGQKILEQFYNNGALAKKEMYEKGKLISSQKNIEGTLLESYYQQGRPVMDTMETKNRKSIDCYDLSGNLSAQQYFENNNPLYFSYNLTGNERAQFYFEQGLLTDYCFVTKEKQYLFIQDFKETDMFFFTDQGNPLFAQKGLFLFENTSHQRQTNEMFFKNVVFRNKQNYRR